MNRLASRAHDGDGCSFISNKLVRTLYSVGWCKRSWGECGGGGRQEAVAIAHVCHNGGWGARYITLVARANTLAPGRSDIMFVANGVARGLQYPHTVVYRAKMQHLLCIL